MRCADTGNPPGQDFPTLGNKLREKAELLVVNVIDLFDAELADLLAPDKLLSGSP
jgi:hypothetical protein